MIYIIVFLLLLLAWTNYRIYKLECRLQWSKDYASNREMIALLHEKRLLATDKRLKEELQKQGFPIKEDEYEVHVETKEIEDWYQGRATKTGTFD